MLSLRLHWIIWSYGGQQNWKDFNDVSHPNRPFSPFPSLHTHHLVADFRHALNPNPKELMITGFSFIHYRDNARNEINTKSGVSFCVFSQCDARMSSSRTSNALLWKRWRRAEVSYGRLPIIFAPFFLVVSFVLYGIMRCWLFCTFDICGRLSIPTPKRTPVLEKERANQSEYIGKRYTIL